MKISKENLFDYKPQTDSMLTSAKGYTEDKISCCGFAWPFDVFHLSKFTHSCYNHHTFVFRIPA